MIKYCILAFFLLSCSPSTTKHYENQPESKIVATSVIEGDVALVCDDPEICPKWNEWLKDLIKKSKKLKIPSKFYQSSPKLTVKDKYFFDLLKKTKELQVSYLSHHCLDGQMSCTFAGENKIFFNINAKLLTKSEWMGVFWHEVFHLLHPEIPHISCSTCPNKKSQLFAECDKNSFSSYGLEAAWHQAYAHRFSSDKKYISKNKFLLKNLKLRICK